MAATLKASVSHDVVTAQYQATHWNVCQFLHADVNRSWKENNVMSALQMLFVNGLSIMLSKHTTMMLSVPMTRGRISLSTTPLYRRCRWVYSTTGECKPCHTTTAKPSKAKSYSSVQHRNRFASSTHNTGPHYTEISPTCTAMCLAVPIGIPKSVNSGAHLSTSADW